MEKTQLPKRRRDIRAIPDRGNTLGGIHPRRTLRHALPAHHFVWRRNAIAIANEVLMPGRQANPAHYHMLEEEHVFILEGARTVLLDEKAHVMNAGHYVCFPVGQKVGHALVNHTTEPCRYLISGNPSPHDVAVHTGTRQVSVKLMGAGYRGTATMDYWEDVDGDA